MSSHLEQLRRLSMSDRRSVVEVLGGLVADGSTPSSGALDPRTLALVRVAALVALDGPGAAFDATVSAALASGATPDDVVETMIAVGPTVGSAHLVSAAPKLAMALGYDVGADLEGAEGAEGA
jgi:alkylhydroperoxidase/carboxymuconolactone decarboxylase family protein YurZ